MSELRRLLEKASPAPWRVGFTDGSGNRWITSGDDEDSVISGGGEDDLGVENPATDGALIVYLRNNAEALLRVVEAAQALNMTTPETAFDSPELVALDTALAALEGAAK